MRRRELLATTAIALLAGCTGSPGSEGSRDTPVPTATATPRIATPEPTETPTPTWSPGGTVEVRDGVSGSETARITVTADGEVEVSELMV
jgi:hypothetical protein